MMKRAARRGDEWRRSVLARPAVHAVWAALALCAAASAPARAQADYPHKPIRFIVGLAPAGAADILARVLGQRLAASFGQQVIIDNRPGANQNIAAELTAKSTPDGYTILIVSSAHTINPSLYKL